MTDTTRSTVSRQRREVSSTLALSTLVTFVRALWKAIRAIRSISPTLYAQSSCAVSPSRPDSPK